MNEPTLQAEREKRETIEFVTILKTMSEKEKQHLRGMVTASDLYKREIKNLHSEIKHRKDIEQSVKFLISQCRIEEADALLSTI